MNIVIYRFSAMGDVALLLPVIRGVLNENPNVQITLVTRSKLFPFFENIDRLKLRSADFEHLHKGVFGLFRLYKGIKTTDQPNVVIDLHQVLRSYLLNSMFRTSGIEVLRYNKGRKEKAKAIRTKATDNLPHTVERYTKPFADLGLRFKAPDTPLIVHSAGSIKNANKFLITNAVQPISIAIAPFAKHNQKIWGITRVDQLIEKINQNIHCTIFLLGGGKAEETILQHIAIKHSNCIVLANKFDLRTELTILSTTKAVVCMDSANMHISALLGIPTLSIWGATHPGLGFSPYNQPFEYQIQYEGTEINCRPCSVYGNKKCIHQSHKCMELIAVEEVYNKLYSIVKSKP
jgi:ADP-heptose:LPS heptosyltransferase